MIEVQTPTVTRMLVPELTKKDDIVKLVYISKSYIHTLNR